MTYIVSKLSLFAKAAELRKPTTSGNVQRYAMLAVMLVYIEMTALGVTRLFVTKY